jgi:hypothetical protein
MLAGFADEVEKIAGNVMSQSISTSNAAMRPAARSTGPKVPKALKVETKPQNYSVVHSQQPMAAQDSAAQAKSVPPPPVRT